MTIRRTCGKTRAASSTRPSSSQWVSVLRDDEDLPRAEGRERVAERLERVVGAERSGRRDAGPPQLEERRVEPPLRVGLLDVLVPAQIVERRRQDGRDDVHVDGPGADVRREGVREPVGSAARVGEDDDPVGVVTGRLLGDVPAHAREEERRRRRRAPSPR